MKRPSLHLDNSGQTFFVGRSAYWLFSPPVPCLASISFTATSPLKWGEFVCSFVLLGSIHVYMCIYKSAYTFIERCSNEDPAVIGSFFSFPLILPPRRLFIMHTHATNERGVTKCLGPFSLSLPLSCVLSADCFSCCEFACSIPVLREWGSLGSFLARRIRLERDDGWLRDLSLTSSFIELNC